jgi:iron complex outermembrane recepter protein
MNRHANEFAARALLAGVLVCASLCFARVVSAEEETRQYDIDIAQLPLSQALEAFSQQTGLQYGYLPTDDDEERLIVGPIQGRLTASQVLTKLLPAGFRFEWVNPRTISIVSPPVNAPPGGVNQAVAGKDQQRSELSKNQRVAMENGGGKSGSARGPNAFDVWMTVEGQRIFDSVFESLDPDIQATVFDRADIDASGASTLTDLVRYITQQPYTRSESYLSDGTQVADLRGLGFDSTLVLLNGRRMVATASAVTVNAVDLNIIPVSAVERVEVVSDSMSAMHGADAIGGVLNIVLRRNIPDPVLDIDYGAAAGGAVERHAAFSASGGGNRGRGAIMFDYFDRGPLLGRERDRWNDQNFTRFGSADLRTPSASPGNISSPTAERLPGLPSSFAAIPSADSGTQLVPADFLPSAGQRNLASLYQYQSVAYARTRKSALAQGEYRLTPQIDTFGEVLYVDRENTSQSEPPALSGALVGGANPHNPFGVDVLADALLTELGPRTSTRRAELLHAAGGVRGRLRDWHWEASLQKSQDDAVTLLSTELDQVRVAEALTASSPSDALNLFGHQGANNSELLVSLLAAPSQSRFRTESIQSVVSAGGPIASLPAGRVEIMAGGEWREERARYDIGAPTSLSGSHQRSILAAFGEVRLPLVSSAAKVPGVEELSLVLSGRLDDYSDIGRTFNPEYALIWRPTTALTLRTSLAKSFRPPSLVDLYLPPVDSLGPIGDPARNGELAFPVWRAGGNLDLKPSSAESLSVGLRLEPKSPSPLRLGANYWRIAIDDLIAIPFAARLLAFEKLFPERVVRGPQSDSDIGASIPGTLQLIDVRRLNLESIRASGVDMNGSVTFDTRAGRFKPEVSATWVHSFSTSDLVEGQTISRVGVANAQGTIPRWRAVVRLSWDRGGLGLHTAMRYVPSYDDVDLLGNRNNRKIESEMIVDAQVSLDLGVMLGEQSPWNGFEIRAGAFNLFDSEPPFAEVGWLSGYDTSQGDLRQRFAYVKVAKKF